MLLIKIFLSGLIILAGAIILNFFATTVGIKGWYDFLKSPKNTSIISYIWLFLIYPTLLGALAYISSLIFQSK